MRKLLLLVCAVLPWALKRLAYTRLCGYSIAPGCRIGLSLVLVDRLTMEPGASIGHLNVVKGLDEVRMGEKATICRLNWIYGFPSGTDHFAHQPERVSRLTLEEHAALTSRHLVDCTNEVSIGAFATFAGFRSQILTHSIDLAESRQSSKPIRIGRYAFVGTGCILLGGSRVPDCSVLGAGSVLTKAYEDTHTVYGGNPAKPIKELPKDTKYFLRTQGFVW